MRLDVAFAALGFLIGNLVGMSATSVVVSLVGLLFAFGGGSAIALIQKLDADARRVAGQCIFALSIGCLLGLYAGIVVSERRLLSPRAANPIAASAQIGAKPYVRSDVAKLADSIDYQRRQGLITPEEAYAKLLEVAKKGSAD